MGCFFVAGSVDWRREYVTLRSHMNRRTEQQVFKALGDPTRRRILDALRNGPQTTGALCAPFALSRYAIMKHLSVLERAGLVVVRRRGRERWNHLNAVPLRRVYERWVRDYESHWAGGLLGLKEHIELGEDAKHIWEGEIMAADSTRAELGIARIELEIEIDAPGARVWQAMTGDVSSWWPREFYAGAEAAKGYHIEPKLGGRMYEDWGDGNGLVWANVVGLDAPHWIHLVGHMAPPYAGPAINMLRLELKASGTKTKLMLSDTITGKVDEKMRLEMHDGWILLFEKGMKAYIESGNS